jgi:outer membrane protein
MRKMLKVIIPVFLLFVISFAAYAQTSGGIRVGVINVQQIMQKSPMAVALNKQLKDQFQPRQDALVKAQSDLQAEIDKLNKNGAVMNTADRSQLQDKIIADRANLQGLGQSFQQDLNAAQAQAMQQFMSKLQSAVNVVAANGRYDLILQRSGTPYVSSALDVTDQVLTELAKS